MDVLIVWLQSFGALFEGTYTRRVVVVFFELFLQLLPFVLSGIFLVTVLNLFLPRERLQNRLARLRYVPLIAASLLGAVSPIGTYALIPLMASLIREKTFPASVLVAFLTASPLINPLLFIMTWGAFGPAMALWRVAAALSLGFCAGLLAKRFMEPVASTVEKASPDTPAPAPTWRRGVTLFMKESRFVFRVFSLSVLAAALTAAFLPQDLVLRIMGGNSTRSVIIAVMAGIPLYACGGGAIPVMQVMMDLGMSKGAVLAFFISGPATKISTLTALFACMERRVIAIYLSVTLLGAFILGVACNHLPF